MLSVLTSNMKRLLAASLLFCAALNCVAQSSYNPDDHMHHGQDVFINKPNQFPATGTIGESICATSSGTLIASPGANCYASAGGSVVAGYMSGFGLSNDGTSPTTVLDIAAGYAADSTNAVMITGTTFKKEISGSSCTSSSNAFVAGSGNCGMVGTGAVQATWYHVCAIIKSSAYDVYFDTSATCANAPSGTTYFQEIGDIETASGAATIIAFTQKGNYVYWAAQIEDLIAGAATSATLVTLSVPPGRNVIPIITLTSTTGTAASGTIWSPLSGSTPPAPVLEEVSLNDAYLSLSGYMTNTSSQLYYLVSASNVNVYTTGWINPHLAPNF